MTRRLRPDDRASLDRIAAALEKLCVVAVDPMGSLRQATCSVTISIDAMRHVPERVLRDFVEGPLAKRLADEVLRMKENKKQK